MEILKEELLSQITGVEQKRDVSDNCQISRCILLGSRLLIKECTYDIRDRIKKITQKFCFCFVELKRIRFGLLKRVYFQNGIIIKFKSQIKNKIALKAFKEADFFQFENMDSFNGSFLVKWFISENDFNNSIYLHNKYFGVENGRSFFERINSIIEEKNLTIGRYNLEIRRFEKSERKELLDAFIESRPEYSLNIPLKRKGVFYYYMNIKRMIKCSDVFCELLLYFKHHFNVKFKDDLTEKDWSHYKRDNSIKNYYGPGDLLPVCIINKSAEMEKDKRKLLEFENCFPYLKKVQFSNKEYLSKNLFSGMKFKQVHFFLIKAFANFNFKFKITDNGKVEILKNTEKKKTTKISLAFPIPKKKNMIENILRGSYRRGGVDNNLLRFCRQINFYFYINKVKNVFYETLKVYMCRNFDEDIFFKYFNDILKKCSDFIFLVKADEVVVRINNAFCVETICGIMNG